MVSYPGDDQLDIVFGALADSTRRAILARLAKGESSVTSLAEPFDMSLPAVSKHLGILERAGLVEREWDGRVRRCRFVAEPLSSAASWLERTRIFWEGQLDALGRYLERDESPRVEPQPKPGPRKKPRKKSPRSRRTS